MTACARPRKNASSDLEPGVLASPPASGIVAGASQSEADGGTVPRRSALAARELSWHFEQGPFGPTEVVISLPAVEDVHARLPVLVAFHGRGESFKGGRRGARGWLDDYLLRRASARLASPPLDEQDFESSVSAARLAQINAALRVEPYAELIVVCPFLPDVLQGERTWADGVALADFIADTLLPRVYAKTPALGTAASTGVDGVSLGGRAALLVGFARPRAFGSVGSLQAAIAPGEVPRLAELAARALEQNPRLRLRILSSDEDYFRSQNQLLSAALSERSVPHTWAQLKGTHSYEFNRGPGALEMLLFHSRVLRGEPPP